MTRVARRPVHELDDTPPPSRTLALVETALLTIAAPAIGWWLHPRDPLFLASPFPWPAVAPLVAGLRYGFAYGFGSSVALCLALATAWRLALLSVAAFPAEWSVGLLVCGMVAGEFRDQWSRRLRRLEIVNSYRRGKLDEFTRTYHLLKVSHDRMEQRLAGSAFSLREALMTLRSALHTQRVVRAHPLLDAGDRVLELFSSYGWIQVASLYALHGGDRLEAVARLGAGVTVDERDPMVRECLERRTLIAVRTDGEQKGLDPADQSTASPLLAAIPLVDVYGRVWGVLAVRDMLFIAFHDESLRMLAVMGGHLGDLFHARERGVGGSAPTAESVFFDEAARSVADLRAHRLPAAILAARLGDPAIAERLGEAMVAQRRGLDHILDREVGGARQLALLMPLTEEPGVIGYLARLEGLVRERFGRALDDAGVAIYWRMVREGDEPRALLDELDRAFQTTSAREAR